MESWLGTFKEKDIFVLRSVLGCCQIVTVTGLETFSSEDRKGATLCFILWLCMLALFQATIYGFVKRWIIILFSFRTYSEDSIPSSHFEGALRRFGASVIFEDKQAFIRWVTEEGRQNKHVDVRYHISQEVTRDSKNTLGYDPSREMMTDTLTNLLGLQDFRRITNLMPIAILLPKIA